MFERREQIQRWFNEIVEKFRQKGATSPDKAMTPQELDLPPRFEEAMKRRLGRSGVFIEVNGKYYLSEERLKQIEQMRSARGDEWNPRKRIMTLRFIQLGIIVLLITLLLVNFLIQSWELRIVTAALLVAWLLITLLQIYYSSRARKRFAHTYCFGLARHLEGTGVAANVLFPGAMKTDHIRNALFFAKLITFIVGKSPEKGAEAAVYLASSREVESMTGRFFKGRTLSDSSAYSHDRSVQQHLWAESAKLTGLMEG